MPEITVSFAKMAYDPSRKDYKTFIPKTGEFKNVAGFLISKAWSPIIWKENTRKKIYFKQSHLIALDFDNGLLSLDDAIQYFSRLSIPAIIGTTKSHQKIKDDNPPCDRFRVVMLGELCASLADYEHTMTTLMDGLPCDKSCKDGARWFAPCVEVVWQSLDGEAMKWLISPPKIDRPVKAYEPGQMAQWVRDLICKGAPQGERHLACYKIGAELTRAGRSEDAIAGMVLKGPLKAIGERDVRRAIANGVEAARN